jgi:hypothetical protein
LISIHSTENWDKQDLQVKRWRRGEREEEREGGEEDIYREIK